MHYKRKGIPEEDEIVLCKVTKIFPNSVFADLLEYNDSGMIHISEVSPGRIRNIRDYVSVGRQVVCKVLRIDREKGHIDLSLRRVNTHQRREKLEEIKQELKSETLIKNLAKKIGIPDKKLYDLISKPVFNDYSHLHLFFRGIVSGDVNPEEQGIDKKISDELVIAVKEKFKEPKVLFQGVIYLHTFDVNGLEKVQKVLTEVEKISSNLTVTYLGAGKYKFILEEKDYKIAEKYLKNIQDILETFNDKISTSEFTRRKAEIEN
ncbi:S1 RNA-binding domain-containing protein [archaeon]|jgi:translation initiation factor 2 subunit 1|nr:S1 RNA-binding domain-containing protein [archaeon]MBT3451446.1 S1 RNA-binding domain-containing protein [archaeon]MBT6868970.1 S1 RNA-binding domain-containing protein [archaeon]MBT7193236.1 S1 RNA-binding domain-containing protein [archaeon]MBT7380091.1 S1 RNA-binding domain-containing protein [archaeon]